MNNVVRMAPVYSPERAGHLRPAMNTPVRLLMVAGEASGDLLGASLLEGLAGHFPALSVTGVGGERMRAAGLTGPFDVNDLSVIGLVEVIRRLPSLKRVFDWLVEQMERERPDLLITIDLPDFNFMLAKRARKLGIPVIHYVCPQVWAWRRGRVKKVARLVNHLLALYPFEPAIFAETALPATFVGHPLVATTRPRVERGEMRRELGVADDAPLVAIMPGSRHGEIKRLLPVMIEACTRLSSRLPGVRFVLLLADTLREEEVRACWPADGVAMPVLGGRNNDLLAAADAALVTSGTATLEVALLGTPMVVAYRLNQLTYEIAKRVILVGHISLANLVAGESLVPERIQHEATAGRLSNDLFSLLTDAAQAQRMRDGFQRIRDTLSQPERQAADVVADFLRQLP